MRTLRLLFIASRVFISVILRLFLLSGVTSVLQRAVAVVFLPGRPVGKAVKFDYARGGETLSASVAPREKGKVEGAEKVYPRWGFTAKEINRFNEPELAFFAPSGGVYVAATAWEGNAATSGLKSRDIVKSMDGKKVETIEDLDVLYKKALDGLPAQDKMSVTVDRKGIELHYILKYREDTEKDDLQ